mmetsp:Transcript_7795/g.48339  ORF Transcript_7795/g.48339 Transcript_7795/m.48339 type:complete len:205 (+) Transcript_7795:3259-3873(+)
MGLHRSTLVLSCKFLSRSKVLAYLSKYACTVSCPQYLRVSWLISSASLASNGSSQNPITSRGKLVRKDWYMALRPVPYAHVPPTLWFRSNSVALCPATRNARVMAKPAAPAPTTATSMPSWRLRLASTLAYVAGTKNGTRHPPTLPRPRGQVSILGVGRGWYDRLESCIDNKVGQPSYTTNHSAMERKEEVKGTARYTMSTTMQ